MKHSLVQISLGLLLYVAGTYTAVAMQRQDELTLEEGRALVYLPPPMVAEIASLGHRTLAADVFWVQALHYSGAPNQAYHYRDLTRFIDLVVHLDPDFEYAYLWGGTSAPYNTGQWTWANVPESSRILQKGLEHFPENWLMWLQLGFNRGIIGPDREGAAEAFANAGRIPGAPPFIGALATRYAASVGAFDAARTYTEAILASTSDPILLELMERRLIEIDLEEKLVFLDGAVQEFIRQHGRLPDELRELVGIGILDSIPREPMGGDYYIEDGEVRSTSLVRGRLRPHEQATGGGTSW